MIMIYNSLFKKGHFC